MKGKIDVRFGLPNVGRLRSRIQNPSKDLSKDIRTALGEVVVEVLNEQTYAIRTKLIKRVAEMDINFKTKAHQDQVYSAVGSLFDSVFAGNQEDLAKLLGQPLKADADDDEEDTDVEPEEDTNVDPAEETPDDEFED